MNSKLNTETIKLIKKDAQLRGAIANATNKSPLSVERWSKKKNQGSLTLLASLKAIEKYTGKSINELLIEAA